MTEYRWIDMPYGVHLAIKSDMPGWLLREPEVCALDGVAALLATQRVAREMIVDWDGVLESETDRPAPVTPQNISDLMRVPRMAEALTSKIAHRL